MRLILVILLLAISIPACARHYWALQTASDICVWTPASAAQGAADRAQDILDEIRAYWIPGPLPSECTFSQTSPFAIFLAQPEAPLTTLAIYSDQETMARDLDRFDVWGLTMPTQLADGTWAPRSDLFQRLPDGASIDSQSILFLSCERRDTWERCAAHELVHALQLAQWDVDFDGWPRQLFRILQEGAARHTEYLLAGLDRFDLRTAGPVALWLAKGNDLATAPEFLLYEIGASLVNAILRRISPAHFWAIFSGPCRSGILHLALGIRPSFGSAVRAACGMSWDALVEAWRVQAAAMTPVDGSHHVYRWLQDAFSLRASLLEPLLSGDERDCGRMLGEAVYDGAAEDAWLDEVDASYRNAFAEPTPEVLEALHEREATLIDYARERAGAVQEVADVLRLGIVARRDGTSTDKYVHRFVEVVNAFIPLAVQQPIPERDP